jgi:hypothetical protein
VASQWRRVAHLIGELAMRLSKLFLATIAATVLLGAVVGGASARSFSSSSQTFRLTFSRLRLAGVFGSFSCRLTLEGSLHTRTIGKVAGTLIGYITAANLGPCQEGQGTILRETLPWHVRYLSFTGTLPAITSLAINVIGYAYRIREPLATCLLRSTAESPVVGTFNREAGGALLTAEMGGTILTSCGVNASFSSDRAATTVLNGTARITVTLI